jgi:ribosome-binding protein aMBF1 (putative translation factor)
MPTYNEGNIEAEADLMEEIRTVCKDRRTQLGLSQEDLAYLITGKEGRHSYINRIENGVTKGLNVRSLSRLLKALRIEMKLTLEII